MNRRGLLLTTCAVGVTVVLGSCRSTPDTLPDPPDARRPELKTEAELAAARAERIRSGEVVPAETPTEAPEQRPAPPPRPVPIRPSRGSIRSDILMVNQSALTVAEALYPLREWIERTRATQTQRGFADQLRRRIHNHVRQEIGSLLVYEKALSGLGDPQVAALDDAVGREIDARVSREFGDSVARLESHLLHYGLTMEQLRGLVKRQLLVSSYTHEFLAPQIHVSRHELLGHYRENMKRYSTEETRELLMIELPLERFLPEGVTWARASQSVQAQARLEAKRAARAAHEALLAGRDFRDVAREYSRGPQAADGGSWGQIGQPLQPPYDIASRQIFEFESGQYSDPIETPTDWYIVQCGKIEPATKTPFEDVQEEIRAELEDRRFNKLASDYIVRLAERATLSDLGAFTECAVERVVDNRWPTSANRD